MATRIDPADIAACFTAAARWSRSDTPRPWDGDPRIIEVHFPAGARDDNLVSAVAALHHGDLYRRDDDLLWRMPKSALAFATAVVEHFTWLTGDNGAARVVAPSYAVVEAVPN